MDSQRVLDPPPELYLVATHIGNLSDLSQHALEVIRSADHLIGEEQKTALAFLAKIGIRREISLLNEHSTKEDLDELVAEIIEKKKSCLFSDSGSPLLEDPGQSLVKLARKKGIQIRAVPGPSAHTTALMLSGFSSRPFLFAGFLSRQEIERKKEIKKIFDLRITVIFYEAPYRYKQLIRSIAEIYPKSTHCFLGLDLTLPEEFQFYGDIGGLLKVLDSLPKALPVLVLAGKNH